MIRLVEVFGLHLLKLDLRQHSARHGRRWPRCSRPPASAPNYPALTPDERFDLLATELENPRPLIPAHLPFTPDTAEVILTFRTMAAIARPAVPGGARHLHHQLDDRARPTCWKCCCSPARPGCSARPTG